MKVFHYNDPDIIIPSKAGESHDPRTKKWWGHIMTNKSCRTHEKFAWLFAPDGKRANSLNHATYKLLTEMDLEHVYPVVVDEYTINKFIERIPALSRFQAHRLFKSLISQSPHLTSTTDEIGYSKKHGTWTHIFLED